MRAISAVRLQADGFTRRFHQRVAAWSLRHCHAETVFVNTISGTHITFDPLKDATNAAKHGVSLAVAIGFEWHTAMTWSDVRRDYGEPRQVALGYVGDRLYAVVYVDRGAQRRIISLRKANRREEHMYATA